jgi:3alpha(or 20beta)-hydroxysteroid dehydrogenase
VFLGIRAVTPAMTRAGGGSIVNTSSIDGFVAVPGLSGYVSSKFAIRGLTKVAALELAPHGIRVNSVHPGYVDTPMLSEAGLDAASLERCAKQIPLGRVGSVADIAAAVAYLASEESAYCSGTELLVDGGLLAGRRLAGEGLD